MLKPDISVFDVDRELRRKLEPRVLAALFESIAEHPPLRKARSGLPLLTVSQAKERLATKSAVYSPIVGTHLPEEWRSASVDPVNMGKLLHEWISLAIGFFRQEGADTLRAGISARGEDECFEAIWRALFRQRLASTALASGVLCNEAGIRSADMAMECVKAWTRWICDDLMGKDPSHFSPSVHFLDTERDLQGVIAFDGRRVMLRGRPDAISFDAETGELRLWEYKFGRQGQCELQIAQLLMYMSLVEAAKGTSCTHGSLVLFHPVNDTDVPGEVNERLGLFAGQGSFPAAVEKAFHGYVGNEAAVRQLKIDLTLALRESPPRLSRNIMFCGPAGVGKTELARRVASCLRTPLLDVNATSVGKVHDLVARIDAELEARRVPFTQAADESGKQRVHYPAFVLFIDEAHALRRQADTFLNLLEPNDRRYQTADRICDFSDATVLMATTDKGRLSRAFLTRFRIIDLSGYTAEEVGAIVGTYFRTHRKVVKTQVCRQVAHVGRLVPRTALERAEDFLTKHTFDPKIYPLNEKGLMRMMEEFWRVDRYGLGRNDHAYLSCVADAPRGRDALAALLSCGREEIEREIEPYLLQIGAIRTTPRGREITLRGRELLAERNKS